MKILGIVPARGGSKRLPGKNIADLGGKPLLKWTIDAALESGVFENGWLRVSTEDEKIGELAGDLWWKRDPLLSKDYVPTWPVVMELYNEYQSADIIVVLQPTSPFRTSFDIKEALSIFNKTNADSVIATKEAPDDLVHQLGWSNRLRIIPNIVTANGAFYGITTEAIKRNENFYTGNVYAYPMPKNRSIDIDHDFDLELARMMVSEGLHLK